MSLIENRLLLAAWVAPFAALLLASPGTAQTVAPATTQLPATVGSAGVVPASAPSAGHLVGREDPLERPLSFTPGKRDGEVSGERATQSRPKIAPTTVVGGLAICIGAFLLFVWATRRSLPQALASLSPEVVESLGRAPLQGRSQMQLIRIGKKLVLLCVSPQGIHPLCEITEAEEVERLAGLCHQARPNSVTSSFRQVLGDYARDPATEVAGSEAPATMRTGRSMRRRSP